MHKPESILENEKCKIPCDFEIQPDLPVPSRIWALAKKKKAENEDSRWFGNLLASHSMYGPTPSAIDRMWQKVKFKVE